MAGRIGDGTSRGRRGNSNRSRFGQDRDSTGRAYPRRTTSRCSLPSCSSSDGRGPGASSRFAGPRFGSGRLEQAQGRLFVDEHESKTSRAFNTLVERLSSRLEAKAVLRVELVADAQPEHAVRLVPWTSAQPPQTDQFSSCPVQSRGRPLRLLNRPLPIDVTSLVADGPPIRMVWNRQDSLVVRSWGPERIATGWWRAQDVERDYYRVEWEDGTHVWVYRDQRNGRWFLHGFFD